MAAVTQRPGASQRSSLPRSQCPCISSATGCAGGPVRRPTLRPFALGRIRTAFGQPQVLSSNRVLLRDESRIRDSLGASRREDRALEQLPSGRDRLRPHVRLSEGDHDSRTGHGLVEGSTLRRRPRPRAQPRGRTTTRLASPTTLPRLTPAKGRCRHALRPLAIGKPRLFQFVDVMHVRDGRIVEHWNCIDQLSFMQQFGLIPTQS